MTLCMAQGNIHYYEFVLKESNFTRRCSTKSILTVNGSFPGPVIRVHKGDTVFVNVHNRGYYGATIHCKATKVTFTTEEGTLWWHAHSEWTRATVHGAIVVLPAAGTVYPFPKPDEEEVIVLACWYKRDLRQMVEQAIETGEDTPRSDAYTFNGQPGDLCPCSNGKKTSATNSYTANQTLGHYYMAARQSSNTKPDILYFDHANATEILQYRGNYTPPSSPFFPSSTLPSYKDFIAASNFTTRFRSLASLEHPKNVPQNATTRMFIAVSMGEFLGPNSSCNGINGNGSKLASSMNNISWVNPPIDVLMAYYRNIGGIYEADFQNDPPSSYNYTGQDLPINTALPMKVKVLEYNETVEIVFQGTNVLDDSEAHPMHLHGHSFYVIGTGIGNFDEETDPKGYNLVDPPLVNTVEVPQEDPYQSLHLSLV
ncbi:hypothetical protein VitviT2T_028370 [Vitis vinifera]|uniref:Laccase-14 n=1 Tax=Vitis vinifera TaxID=29760 RepID=A0ABY9DWL9_VITVI|nr:hypothetical protein VitviT2T_028370 [Vitis vinifera]